jgi:flagellar protein FlaI
VVAIQAMMKIQKKRARKIKSVVEVIGIDPSTKELLTNQVFAWNPRKNEFDYFGRGYLFDRIAEQQNLTEEELLEEYERRKDVITWMKEKGIRNYVDVGEIIAAYYKYPEEVIKRMGK